MALNTVCIMGRLVADPELRQTQSGTPVASFTVAVDKGGKDDGADFFDCIAWRGTAEHLCKWFKKGKMIALSGRLQTRMWEDKQGNKRKAVEIVANDISFCGDKDNTQGTNNGTASNFGGNDRKPFDFSSNDMGFRELPDDDGELPF